MNVEGVTETHVVAVLLWQAVAQRGPIAASVVGSANAQRTIDGYSTFVRDRRDDPRDIRILGIDRNGQAESRLFSTTDSRGRIAVAVARLD